MGAVDDSEQRLALLCKRMGRLWSADVKTNVATVVSAKQMTDGRFVLIGHLLRNPKINFQAFQNTMRKAWRLENVDFKPLEEGVFAITFTSEVAKKRVIDQGPWSFANHLLILRQWTPDTTALEYCFSTCDFWVHILGIPFEWTSVDLVREIVGKIGQVQEARLEEKGMVSYGKARVSLDLSKPLQSGTLAENGARQVWLDFKYERLPYFCFSCGKIGHYAVDCDEISYKEEEVISDEQRLFGPWLKAEVAIKSPFRALFLSKQQAEDVLEEHVSINPEYTGQIVLYEKAENFSHQYQQEDTKNNKQEPSVFVNSSISSFPCLVERSVDGREKQTTVPSNFDVATSSLLSKKVKQSKQKIAGNKKYKRYCPYGTSDNSAVLINDGQLLDTPIHVMEGSVHWALVASPNKPPEEL